MYFPVVELNNQKKLQPEFIITSNGIITPEIIEGNIKVITSRFRDGEFLYQQDIKKTLSTMGESLNKIIYQKELGTIKDKLTRIKTIGITFYHFIKIDIDSDFFYLIKLMKNDLQSLIVYEFPELQGKMGKYYALKEGINIKIANAIEEHYYPTESGGELPQIEIAQIAACSDKLDTIIGCFSINADPKGSKDPYSLRRHAFGILRIIDSNGWDIDLIEIIKKISINYIPFLNKTKNSLIQTQEDLITSVLIFFKSRFTTLLLESQFEKDVIDAVLTVNNLNIYRKKIAVKQIQENKQTKAFLFTAELLKRIDSIIKSSKIPEDILKGTFINKKQLTESAEINLYENYQSIEKEINNLINNCLFYDVFKKYLTLKPMVENFFKKVFIQVDDQKIKKNRLSLLFNMTIKIKGILDIHKINIQK